MYEFVNRERRRNSDRRTGIRRRFFKLPAAIQSRIQLKLDSMGTRLANYPHFRMVNSDQFRLRVGDYRVIYRFDLRKREIYLLAIGHRREIYR